MDVEKVYLGEDGEDARQKLYRNDKRLSDGLNVLQSYTDRRINGVSDVFKEVYAKKEDLESIAVGMIFKPAVASVSSLESTYPNAEKGWAAKVLADDFIYQYDGQEWNNTGLSVFPNDVVTINQLSETLAGDTETAPSDAAVKKAVELNASLSMTELRGSVFLDNSYSKPSVSFGGGGQKFFYPIITCSKIWNKRITKITLEASKDGTIDIFKAILIGVTPNVEHLTTLSVMSGNNVLEVDITLLENELIGFEGGIFKYLPSPNIVDSLQRYLDIQQPYTPDKLYYGSGGNLGIGLILQEKTKIDRINNSVSVNNERLAVLENSSYHFLETKDLDSSVIQVPANISLISGNLTVKANSPNLWDVVALKDIKRVSFTPTSVRSLWFMVGYKDEYNICVIGASEFNGRIVNVDLLNQTYTIIADGSFGVDLSNCSVMWSGDTLVQIRENKEVINVSKDELKLLGANIDNCQLGFVFYNIPGFVHTGLRVTQIKIEKSKLKDLSFSIMGDSISTFSGYVPTGNAVFYPNATVSNVNQTWWKMLENETGMKLISNESWSGSRLSNGRGTTSMFCNPTRFENLGNPDIILVFGGTNDFNQGSPDCAIGEYDWVTNGARDLSVFRQSYQFLVEKLLTKYPFAKVFLMVPIVRTRENKLFEPNAVGWTYQDLREVILTIASKYGVESIDTSKCGINFYNGNTYLSDGLHPNAEGMILIKDYVYAQLNEKI